MMLMAAGSSKHQQGLNMMRLWRSFVVRGVSYLEIESENKQSGSALPLELRHNLTRFKEYRKLLEYARSVPEIRRHFGQVVHTWLGDLPSTPWEYLSLPLVEQARRKHRGTTVIFDSKTFKGSARRLVNYFFDDFMSFLYVVPLRNFESNAKEIRVSSSLRIRSIKRAELAPFSRHEFSSKVQVRAPSFALEMTHRAKKYFGTSHENEEGPAPGDEIESVFSAMRLFKQGTFAHDLMTVIPSIEFPRMQVWMGVGLRSWLGPVTKSYVLKDSEVRQFCRFCSSFLRGELPSVVKIALRRFGFAYDRGSLEDKLIDYVVALESLFLREGEQAEIGHRLSLRVAKLLSKTFARRLQVKKKVSDLYSKRSRIAHGDETSLQEEDILRAEDLVRSSLKALLVRLRHEEHDNVLLHLDLD
jgi:hypothetical protein